MAKKAKKAAKKPVAKKTKVKKVSKTKANPAKKKAAKPAKKLAKKPAKKPAKKVAAKKPAAKKAVAAPKAAPKQAAKASAPKAAAPKAAAPKAAAPVVVTPMPQVGDEAPDFTAMATDGSKKTLSSFRGSKHVVLYFYPKDDTPGCTVEACSFNSSSSNFGDRNTVVLGVSPDGQASHQKFSDKFNLGGITLLSDEDHKICQSYGVWVEKNMYGRTYMGVQRATFLIGKDGRIHAIWPNVKVDGHSEEVLKVIGSLAG
jgi:peroxiredoxin Q/BCP